MKSLIFSIIVCLFIASSFSQNPCHLVAPDSVRTVPHYNHIFQGDTVTFTAYGGKCDSSAWFSLYGEECCVERLDSNRTGVFTRRVWASDIFYIRIESFCDTTWGTSIDIDAYTRLTGIEEVVPSIDSPDETVYDLLGRIVSNEAKGLLVRKRKLIFK